MKDRFGVVGWFGFVGYGFMGVLCFNETQDRWWWWLRRIGLGWWVGLDLWVCCAAVKPKTGGGGGYEGSVWGGGLVWIRGLWIYGCVVLQ